VTRHGRAPLSQRRNDWLSFRILLYEISGHFRFAVRTREVCSFALIAIVSLALGIGANTAMFSYVAVLLRPLPVPDSGRIVEVNSTSPDTRLGRLSYAEYVDLRDHTKTLRLWPVMTSLRRNRHAGEPGSKYNSTPASAGISADCIQPVSGAGSATTKSHRCGPGSVRSSAITCGTATSRATVRSWDGEFAQTVRLHHHRRGAGEFHWPRSVRESDIYTDACVPAGGSGASRLSYRADPAGRVLLAPQARRERDRSAVELRTTRFRPRGAIPRGEPGSDGHGAGLRSASKTVLPMRV
jgi:hypothetical protein